MKQINLAGVDVSAKTLVVKLQKNGVVQEKTATFDNTPKGYKSLLTYVTKRGVNARVCMEATGIYHVGVAVYLSNSPTVEIMVANPKAIKHFGVASMKRAKTDPLDAHLILDYLSRMEFQLWTPPSQQHLELQSMTRRMQQLKGEMVREKNRLHAQDNLAGGSKAISHDIEVNLRYLKTRIELLEGKALKAINGDELLEEKFSLLISVKGIGQSSAIQILSELVCLPEEMQASQWVAFAGLDPRAVESGTSVNKARRISKCGNKFLRTALYMPAWVAVRHDEQVKAFYDKLIAAGKAPMQAIVAVMRKLLCAIWGMLNSKTSWDSTKFYAGKIVLKENAS